MGDLLECLIFPSGPFPLFKAFHPIIMQLEMGSLLLLLSMINNFLFVVRRSVLKQE